MKSVVYRKQANVPRFGGRLVTAKGSGTENRGPVFVAFDAMVSGR
jgi:hypothetical protein